MFRPLDWVNEDGEREMVYAVESLCASESEGGVYNPQNIYNMRPTEEHYAIADWALAGNRLPDLSKALWFYNPFSPNCRGQFPSNVGYLQTRIGDHCFYNPTDAYYKT